MPEDTREPIPESSRSPVSYLTIEQFNAFKGQLVAFLLDGPDKGTVIAHAPLDFAYPMKPRIAVHEQVAASAFRDRRYQLRQILDTPATKKQ